MEILLLKNFFPIVDTCLSCEDIAVQSCAMVPRWRLFGDFLGTAFLASRCFLNYCICVFVILCYLFGE